MTRREFWDWHLLSGVGYRIHGQQLSFQLPGTLENSRTKCPSDLILVLCGPCHTFCVQNFQVLVSYFLLGFFLNPSSAKSSSR